MSRLIVKNVPKAATEDSLRKLFGDVGTITEVSLKKSFEGKYRGYAFIGYHNEADCETAIKSFNNTYFNTSKLKVELCRPLEKTVPVAPEDKSKKQEEKIDESKLLEKYKDDPMFEEFLQVHDANKIQKLKDLRIEVSKDTQEENDSEKEEEQKSDDKKKNKSEKKKKDLKLFTVKLQNLPWHFVKKDIKDFFRPLKCFSIRTNSRLQKLAFVGFKTESVCQRALLKDKSYMKGQCVRVKRCTQDSSSTDGNKQLGNRKWKNQEEALKHEESIAESGNIFLRNLAYTVTEDEIEKLFSQYGPISEVNLPVDPNTRQLKGFGTVTFLMPEHAGKAYSELDSSIFHGRMLHLLPGKNKDKSEDEDTNYKEKKQKKQKADAGKSHNWNALFVDSNAVAEVITERYGTSKQALIGPEGKGSAPVRLALAETQIVTETKNYLEQMGVKLDAFNSNNQKRSKTVILVKNLPARTGIVELREIFEKFGQLGRIILPPSGLTAIIEFLEPSEARKAFRNLAYSRFKNAPLYLEWAPAGSLEENNGENTSHDKEPRNTDQKEAKTEKEHENVNKEVETDTNQNETETKENSLQSDKIEKKSEQPVAELGTTLFIKNLNPLTTTIDFKKHFETCGKVLYASINVRRKGPKTESLGTGFVRYIDRADAEKALTDLQNSVLDGNNITLVKSDRMEKHDLKKTSTDNPQSDMEKKLKISVKNVPFEATQKEVEEIFRTFGGIKSVRLPKKWAAGGSHRGFGFVEFTNEKDAKIAFEALGQSTHLLGRRLILEWAKVDDSTEETRKRTAKHYWDEGKKKQSKKSVFNID